MKGNNSKSRSGHFKVRRRRGNYLTVSGKYPSHQNEFALYFEGFRERDLFVHLAFDESVERVDDHPFLISYKVGKAKKKYTPDAKIVFRPMTSQATARRPLVVEVKVESELERRAELLQPTFDAAAAHCDSLEMDFLVVTEKTLSRPAVRNLRFLYRYRQHRPAPSLLEAIRKLLAEKGPLTLQQLIADLGPASADSGKVIAAAWHLVSMRTVAVNLHAPLSIRSELCLGPWSTCI